MTRRSLYRRRIQFSLRSLFVAMTTVPLLVYGVRWLAEIPLLGLGGLAIGIGVAILAYRLLNPEDTRTLYLQMLVASLVGTYAFWIPASFLYYFLGVGIGLILTWQWAEILTFLCACYGISHVNVYTMPHWRPSLRNATWPDSMRDSSDVT